MMIEKRPWLLVLFVAVVGLFAMISVALPSNPSGAAVGTKGCIQYVDPVSGAGSFICDFSGYSRSGQEGPQQQAYPRFEHRRTYQAGRYDSLAEAKAITRGGPAISPPERLIRIDYQPDFGSFSRDRWCSRHSGRCYVEEHTPRPGQTRKVFRTYG